MRNELIQGSIKNFNENSVEKTFEKRRQIIEDLKQKLSDNPSVSAFCLEGADAEEAVDQYSDLDMRIIVDESHSNEIFKIVESIISKDSPIDFKFELNRPQSKTNQALYHLKGTSKFFIIDIMIQECSDCPKIKANKKLIMFDKIGVLSEQEPGPRQLNDYVKTRIENIESNASFRSIYLERELERGNFLESVGQYQKFILEKLVETLRLLYCPEKNDFYLKHLSKDLPAEIVSDVEDLYRINTINEIKEKKQKADKLLFKAIEELKGKYY